MDESLYVDVEVLAEIEDDDYLLRISKQNLNYLVNFNENLVITHWDGEKPVPLESYGTHAVRTEGDANEDNNLSSLPRLELAKILS